ncbi:unnamed protein product [Adineta steineri]|uniref:Uncharacterized protein n=1 Tax=Adineta steineri TaxID=433720 RepID=A0A814AKS7_9BILA|nr:unnamed protein product [Adineta steineri]
MFTEHLTLMRRLSNNDINSLDDSIAKRFYSQILSRIHYKIKWLDLEPLYMERILLAADYPNLHGLSLFNVEHKTIIQELFLNISIGRCIPDKSFLDRNDLKRDVINHMSKLNKFTFSIHSSLIIDDLNELPSNENIQCSCKGLEDYQIVSYIHSFPAEGEGQCHIYSQPYTMNSLYGLTNSFPGRLFNLFDWRQYLNRQKTDANNKKLNDEIKHTTKDISVSVFQLFRFADCIDILLLILGLCFMLGHAVGVIANVILFGRITGLFATTSFAVDCDNQYKNLESGIINNTLCPLGINLDPLNYDRLHKLCHYDNKTISSTLAPLTPLFHENVMHLVYLFFGKSIKQANSI